jgi:uncharacterized protein (DUF1778 family)
MVNKKTEGAKGSARMKELGRMPIQLWVTREEMDELRWAAKLNRRPVTQFILVAATEVTAELRRKFKRRRAKP